MKKYITALSLSFALSTGITFAQQCCPEGCSPKNDTPKKEIKNTTQPIHDHNDGTHSIEHIAKEELKQLNMKMKYDPAETLEEHLEDQKYKQKLEELLKHHKGDSIPADTIQQNTPWHKDEFCPDEAEPIIT